MVFSTERLRGRLGLSALFLLGAVAIPPPSPGSGGGAHLLHLPTLCLFRTLTGWPCPACGMTRSVVCAAHGLGRDSLFYHPLGWVVLVALLGDVLIRFRVLPHLPGAASKWAWPVALGLLFACWAARLTGWLPTPPP